MRVFIIKNENRISQFNWLCRTSNLLKFFILEKENDMWFNEIFLETGKWGNSISFVYNCYYNQSYFRITSNIFRYILDNIRDYDIVYSLYPSMVFSHKLTIITSRNQPVLNFISAKREANHKCVGNIDKYRRKNQSHMIFAGIRKYGDV